MNFTLVRLVIFLLSVAYAIFMVARRKIWVDKIILAIVSVNLVSFFLDETIIEDNIDLYVVYEFIETGIIAYCIYRLGISLKWIGLCLGSLLAFGICIFILPHFAISISDVFFTSQYGFLDTDEFSNYKILDAMLLIPMLFKAVWNINKSTSEPHELKLTIFLFSIIIDKAIHAFLNSLDSLLFSNIDIWFEVSDIVIRGNTILHFLLFFIALTLKK